MTQGQQTSKGRWYWIVKESREAARKQRCISERNYPKPRRNDHPKKASE